MRQILSLWWLQVRYLAMMLRNPRESRDFWYHLYHEARRADKLARPGLKYNLASRDVEAIFPGIDAERFSLEEFREDYGGVSLLEAKILAASIRLLKPRTLFEIGTFNGASTVQLALNAPAEAVVHTVDLPENHPLRHDQANVDVVPRRVGECYAKSGMASKIRQHYGDTAEFDFSPFAGQCDWIFVDAAHTYEYVASDTRNALRMLRKGGVIFWHDVNLAFEGNCRALEEFAAKIPIVRVRGTSLACYRS
jgi:predicted O-methyltransferase YrrM